MERQKALEAIDAEMQAVRGLKQAIDGDKSLLAEIGSRKSKVSLKSLKPKKAIQMNEHYTRKQAMERLGITSTNTFLRIVRKYPEIFANVHQSPQRDKYPWYDKAAVDQFAERRRHVKDHEIEE